ncbi:hypothetical protein F8M41_024786 [Gigaspora margarita]|uniref:Uncharacterized protein n=1 Tax=Gigaspora margarita TaxID=4874 RepID=A0A8H4ABC0_GIGMA|nr:hypothetical protein F8M41_024786 [Gigaspora margarita]
MIFLNDLGRNPFKDDCIRTNKISMRGATELANALRKNKLLTSLNLLGNRISLGLVPLLKALTTNRNLTLQTLVQISFAHDAGRMLADYLRECSTLAKIFI